MGGGCPVMHTKKSDGGGSSAASEGGCPVMAGGGGNGGGGGGVAGVTDGKEGGLNPANNMPFAELLQGTAEGQTRPLSKFRMASSIPNSSSSSGEGSEPPSAAAAAPGAAATARVPAHQPNAGEGTWMYPSEQQYYNAMRRKGWAPREGDMPAIVAIHNTVNERSWREVLRWEAALHPGATGPPKLVKFVGRPKDISPKAWLMTCFGYSAPFDRHDWVVERQSDAAGGAPEHVRYVIDFYTGQGAEAPKAQPLPGGPAPPLSLGRKPVAIHIDARPAVDTPGSLLDRLRMPFVDMLGLDKRQ